MLELTELVDSPEASRRPAEPAATHGPPAGAPARAEPRHPGEHAHVRPRRRCADLARGRQRQHAGVRAPDQGRRERRAEGRTAASGLTVEQLLVDLLTPMLRDWLDTNLPGIVERVVEQEVKKLARRAELM